MNVMNDRAQWQSSATCKWISDSAHYEPSWHATPSMMSGVDSVYYKALWNTTHWRMSATNVINTMGHVLITVTNRLMHILGINRVSCSCKAAANLSYL